MSDLTEHGGIVNPPRPTPHTCPVCTAGLVAITEDATREERRANQGALLVVVVFCPATDVTPAREALHGVTDWGAAVARAAARMTA